MPTPFPLTLALGEQICHLDAHRLPEPVAQAARDALLDTLTVSVPGLLEPAAQTYARTRAHLGESVLTPSLAMAGWLGTAAHALDYDDVAYGGHPSAVLVPATLVSAAMAGVTDSHRILSAYVAGYETWGEIASREAQKYHSRGLHPTGLLGPMAAAATAAVMLHLPPAQVSAALAMAASASAGLMANFGSMTKPMHAGRAAIAGMESAWLAQAGMTASRTALEASHGFLQAFSPSGKVALTRGLQCLGVEDQWRLRTDPPSVKKFPVCYAGHRCIDATLAWQAEHGPCEPAAVTRVVAHLSQRNSDILRFTRPRTVSEARFSLEYFIACALDGGEVSLAQLTDAAIASPVRRAWMDRIERVMETELDPEMEGFAKADFIEVIYADGRRRVSPRITRAKGHADLPLNAKERLDKAHDCLRSVGMLTARQDDWVAGIARLGTTSQETAAPLLSWLTGMAPIQA